MNTKKRVNSSLLFLFLFSLFFQTESIFSSIENKNNNVDTLEKSIDMVYHKLDVLLKIDEIKSYKVKGLFKKDSFSIYFKSDRVEFSGFKLNGNIRQDSYEQVYYDKDTSTYTNSFELNFEDTLGFQKEFILLSLSPTSSETPIGRKPIYFLVPQLNFFVYYLGHDNIVGRPYFYDKSINNKVQNLVNKIIKKYVNK